MLVIVDLPLSEVPGIVKTEDKEVAVSKLGCARDGCPGQPRLRAQYLPAAVLPDDGVGGSANRTPRST